MVSCDCGDGVVVTQGPVRNRIEHLADFLLHEVVERLGAAVFFKVPTKTVFVSFDPDPCAALVRALSKSEANCWWCSVETVLDLLAAYITYACFRISVGTIMKHKYQINLFHCRRWVGSLVVFVWRNASVQ